MKNNIINNNIKKIARSKGVSNNLIAILLDIDGYTMTKLMNNVTQPNSDQIKKLIDLLEVSYQDLINDERIGLARALEDEFDNLIKNKKMSLKVAITNKKTGKQEKVFNPEIVKTIKSFEMDLKKRK